MRVDIEIRVEVGAAFIPAAVESGIRTRLEELFLLMAKGETVFRSGLLSAVQSVEGVVLAKILKPQEDVLVSIGEAAVLGRLLISKINGGVPPVTRTVNTAPPNLVP